MARVRTGMSGASKSMAAKMDSKRVATTLNQKGGDAVGTP